MEPIKLNLPKSKEFLSTEARLDEINSWLDQFEDIKLNAEKELTDKINFTQEKINRLYHELELLKQKQFEFREDIYKQRRAKLDERKALVEARKREELQEQYQKTADLIREIVADFPTWKMAREYQAEDIISIIHQYVIGEPGIMNANEMALGKTFESIVALYILRELFKRETGRLPRVLWLTKSSIVTTGGTIAELSRWDPDYKMISLSGSDAPDIREFTASLAKSGTMGLLTNYETCRTTKTVQQISWDIIVMDEVHKLKGGANISGPTKVWEAVKDITTKARFIMMLTGTPLVNKSEEMWSYMHIFAPEEFPDVKDFTRRFQGFKQAAGTFKMTIEADKLLKTALKGRLIRRTAHEVGLQLPQVVRQDIFLDHNEKQGAIYKQMKEEFMVWLDTTTMPLTANNILTQLLRLRQINVLPVATFNIKDDEGNIIGQQVLNERDSSKLDAAVQMILDHGEQAVGFCNFNEPLNELAFRLSVEGLRVAVISSATSKEMGDYETEFQQGRINVLLINIQMGEGLNLHKDPDKWPGGAGVGFTLDRWWNNAKNDQCFKRIVRPGAPGPIFFYDYYVQHSVDDYIKMLCDEKDAEFSSLTDHRELRPKDEWKNLLEGLL